MVGDAELVLPDVYASNGVIHLVSSLLLPPGALQLTPQKYLMALNCTKFVSLLDSVNLTNLINDTNAQYTILAPRDDIIAIFDDPAFPPAGSDELKKLLQYHFIPGNWTAAKLKHGTLLKTALKEPGLNNMSQVLPVEIHSDDEKKTGAFSIRFGGAGIIGDPGMCFLLSFSECYSNPHLSRSKQHCHLFYLQATRSPTRRFSGGVAFPQLFILPGRVVVDLES